jgi:hypothetical protein
LIDNALRYSSPTTSVWVSAARGGDGGVLLWVSDSGLGMNDGDRRIANMRLQSGGEVTPDNARHMGLFVVGRLAARHGLRVGLRGPTTDEESTGTTAEIYLPPSVLVEALVRVPPPNVIPDRPVDSLDGVPAGHAAAQPAVSVETSQRNGGAGTPVTLLPRRTPGSSGITDVPAQPAEQQQGRKRRELATPWWENGAQPQPPEPQPPEPQPPEPQQAPAAAQAPSDTSAFFAARAGAADDDVIYQGMLAEWLSDPHDLVQSSDLDWQSVWDRGWSLAAEAEDKPVESRTDHGLPVRSPGAQLVPGAGVARGFAEQDGPDKGDQDSGPASDGAFHPDRQPQHAAVVRDPEAVRASIGGHFGGVHSGRSHARETGRGDQE